jgi:hypothetical protein
MEAAIAIGGLVLLVVLGGWVAISEVKSGAVTGEALKVSREVIDGLKRFEKARRASAGLPRVERLALMLQELREGSRSEVPEDE